LARKQSATEKRNLRKLRQEAKQFQRAHAQEVISALAATERKLLRLLFSAVYKAVAKGQERAFCILEFHSSRSGINVQ
jgi:hypothetical protein